MTKMSESLARKNKLMYMRRLQRGLTFVDMERATGITSSTFAALENQRSSHRIDVIYATSVLLDMAIEDLIPSSIKEKIDESVAKWEEENGSIVEQGFF